MNRIELEQTLPVVFAQRTDIQSDIWLRSVTLERGHLYLVEAGSGTGKTSLCSYLIGHRSDYTGKILYDGRDIRSFGPAEWVQMRCSSLSSLFQDLRLFPELSARENVEIKNNLTHFKSKQQVEEMFEQLGIADKIDVPVRLMSFGQQQRVALIRALAQPFDFLLADEPTSHLDDANAQAMANLLMQEVGAQGASLVVTSIGKHPSLPYETIYRL